jgi:hypothetical protein
VQQANLEAQHARMTAEAGPALYLAKPFGSTDRDGMARLITALLVDRSLLCSALCSQSKRVFQQLFFR